MQLSAQRVVRNEPLVLRQLLPAAAAATVVAAAAAAAERHTTKGLSPNKLFRPTIRQGGRHARAEPGWKCVPCDL